MSPNRRIFLNIVATYGRSLYALVCGLFISRWVLAALGKTDFGLYGVAGGMMAIALLAFTMRQVRISPEAVGRALAYTIMMLGSLGATSFNLTARRNSEFVMGAAPASASSAFWSSSGESARPVGKS